MTASRAPRHDTAMEAETRARACVAGKGEAGSAGASRFAKRILVTGGAGFIGSHTVIHLVQRYPQYLIVNLDVLDYCSCLGNVHAALASGVTRPMSADSSTSSSSSHRDTQSSDDSEHEASDAEGERDGGHIPESVSTSSSCVEPSGDATEGTSTTTTTTTTTATVHSLPPNYKFVQGSVLDAALLATLLRRERIDTVLHLAAQSHVDNSFADSLAFTTTNMLGTHILLEAARVYGGITRFLHVSTDEVYGEGSSEVTTPAMREDHVLEPTNPYAASKAAAELMVRAYRHSFSLPIIISRSNNVYGPHQYPEKLIPKCINQAMRGQPITIHGDGSHARNYVYVSDVVAAFDLLLHRGKIGEVYNIGGETELSNTQVAMDVLRELDRRSTSPSKQPQHQHHHQPQRPDEPQACSRHERINYVRDRAFNDKRYSIDDQKMRALGWREQVSWANGLACTIAWWALPGERFPDIERALLAHPDEKPTTTSLTTHDHEDETVMTEPDGTMDHSCMRHHQSSHAAMAP